MKKLDNLSRACYYTRMNEAMIEALNGTPHPLFDFVQIAYQGKPWGWYFEVSSPEQYLTIYQRFFSQARANAIYDFVCSKEYRQYRPDLTENIDHARTHLAPYLMAICDRAADNQSPMSPFHMAVELDKSVANICLKVEQYGTIYVNYNGGYMTLGKDFTIINRVKQAFFPNWKKDDIRIVQWPGGTHYYAKIGTLDVVVNGQQKWDTRDAAQAAAENYFNELTAKSA